MSTPQKWMRLVAAVLILIFVVGIGGACYFWGSTEDEHRTAFFALLQFIAAFALILLTYFYVAATQQYVETARAQLADLNKPPKITVVADRLKWANSPAQFFVEIANPSVRATSVAVKSVQVGHQSAQNVCFVQDQRECSRVTIPARDLIGVGIKMTFQVSPVEIAVLHETAILEFEDVFHGKLPPVQVQL